MNAAAHALVSLAKGTAPVAPHIRTGEYELQRTVDGVPVVVSFDIDGTPHGADMNGPADLEYPEVRTVTVGCVEVSGLEADAWLERVDLVCDVDALAEDIIREQRDARAGRDGDRE